MLQDTNCPKCNAPLDTAGRCTGCGFYTITTPVIFPHIAHVVTQPYPATQMTPAEIEGAQMAAVALLGKIDRLEAEVKRMKEVIKWYADKEHYRYYTVANTGLHPWIQRNDAIDDNGEKARKILAELEEGK